jgi:hypothetical protein
VARERDGGWEVRGSGGWTALPTDAVTRAPRESQVLREAARRERALKPKHDPAQRIDLARWMVTEGLVSEALGAIDAVLDDRPHYPAALALLTSSRFLGVPSLQVPGDQIPAAQEALMRWAAQAPIAARELALVELARIEDHEQLHADLLGALCAFSLRRRVFAAQAIGRLFPGQDAKRLLQHALLDTSAAVRRSAAQALSNSHDTSLIAPVVRALGSQNPRVRVQSAEALGFMGYPAAVEPLMAYLTLPAQTSAEHRMPHSYIFVGRQSAYIQDFDVEVATFQAVADPQVNILLEGSVLEAGIQSSGQYSNGAEASAARSSLSRLTGAHPGHTKAAWQRWWKAHREDWRAEQRLK